MAPISVNGSSEWAVDLALATSNSILQIAIFLKGRQAGKHLKRLLRYLPAHCALVSDHVRRIRTAVGPDNEVIVRVLELFESLISPKVRPIASTGGYLRQQALNHRWDAMRNRSMDAKFAFAASCLALEQPSAQHVGQRLEEFFDAWDEDVLAKYPEDGTEWSLDEQSIQKGSRAEPSYAVQSAAQLLFKALSRSNKCECCPKHDLDARLSLRTHRKLGAIEEEDHSNDFEIFLASRQDWQEAHVRTVRDTIVRFVVDDEPRPPALKKKLEYVPMPVKKLCEQLQKMRKMTSKRLELKVENGRLLKLRSEKSQFIIDVKKRAVSLQQFLKSSPGSLTAKTKRILAVLLSYSVLHLHNTPWLQSTWDSSNILFFQISSSVIPLRPFIQTQLTDESIGEEKKRDIQWLGERNCHRGNDRSCGGWSNDIADDLVDPDDLDPDDLDPNNWDPGDTYANGIDPDEIEHPFPTLVNLAVVLMELYLAAPFDVLAMNRGIDFQETMDGPARSLNVALVFEEYKCEIPQNSQFYYAIEKCLDTRTWEDDDGQALEEQALRVRIYEEVVRPLEDELCDGFNFITIEELDTIAEKVDFGSWGKIIHNQHEGTPFVETPVLTKELVVSHQQQYFSVIPHALHNQLLAVWGQKISDSVLSVGSTQGHPSTSNSEYEAAKFYDDEKPSESHSRAELESYLTWRAKYQAVLRKYIEPHIKSPPECAVKIAVLDSGVDETHESLDTGQIKAKRNWTNPAKKKRVHDYDGHGTFTASLLIDYAPDAELYIAKIAEGRPPPPRVIAEAIRAAVDEWNVEIISMSFGYPTNQLDGYSELENALLYAYSKGVLLFAAASNNGANQDRAYPARDPHVICVHSTDSKGNRSKFSPTALARDHNIATIGEAVQSAWPVNLCNKDTNPESVQCKSGTSYATPIIVGIAAFLLQYVRIHLPDKAHLLRRQEKMKDILLKLADKTQQSLSRDGYNYVALSLFSDNLFGKDKSFIDETIGELLKR